MINITFLFTNLNALKMVYGKEVAKSMIELSESGWFQEKLIFKDDQAFIPKDTLIIYYNDLISMYHNKPVARIFQSKIDSLSAV